MRGKDHQQSQMFSYLSPETRVRKDHPLRLIRVMVDEILAQLSATIRQHVCECRPTVHSSGEAVAGAVTADAVFDSQRAAADGGDRITAFCFAGLWD